ncbi:unnamed protein product [Malus baccata var. baccata]
MATGGGGGAHHQKLHSLEAAAVHQRQPEKGGLAGHQEPQPAWKPTFPAKTPNQQLKGRQTTQSSENRLRIGQFGVTYLCTEISTGNKYACKSISKRKLVTKNDKEDIKREIQIVQHLSGQANIVEFEGCYEDKLSVHVIAEILSEEEIHGLKAMFSNMDTDNSGTITYDELKSGLARLGSKLTEAEVKQLMEADGRINYEKFSTMMRSGMQPQAKLF